jgi:hypothetical protein
MKNTDYFVKAGIVYDALPFCIAVQFGKNGRQIATCLRSADGNALMVVSISATVFISRQNYF